MPVESFFIPSRDHQLYALYHPPGPGEDRNLGIICCPAIGHEYLLSHRALHNCAERLAQVGYHVLRFDYACCGNSSGDFEAANLCQWEHDLHAVITELSQGCGITGYGILGLRWGANLAYRWSTQDANLQALLLWDPISSGDTFLDRLAQAHTTWLQGSFVQSRRENEFLGYYFSEQLQNQLRQYDTASHDLHPHQRLLGLTSCPDAPADHWLNTVISTHANATYIQDSSEYIWRYQEGTKHCVPPTLINHIITWFQDNLT